MYLQKSSWQVVIKSFNCLSFTDHGEPEQFNAIQVELLQSLPREKVEWKRLKLKRSLLNNQIDMHYSSKLSKKCRLDLCLVLVSFLYIIVQSISSKNCIHMLACCLLLHNVYISIYKITYISVPLWAVPWVYYKCRLKS